MTTTQSEDPNEKIDHPRHYNQHPSGIECIELIENLPCNIANAIKYVWRCGLKTSETPKRDLGSAKWYTMREIARIELYELEDEPKPKTEIVWRSMARKVIAADEKIFIGKEDSEETDTILARYLRALLDGDLMDAIYVLEEELETLEEE